MTSTLLTWRSLDVHGFPVVHREDRVDIVEVTGSNPVPPSCISLRRLVAIGSCFVLGVPRHSEGSSFYQLRQEKKW